MLSGFYLAAELLNVLRELAMFTRIVHKATDILLVAFAAQSHECTFVILKEKREIKLELKDLPSKTDLMLSLGFRSCNGCTYLT